VLWVLEVKDHDLGIWIPWPGLTYPSRRLGRQALRDTKSAAGEVGWRLVPYEAKW
jgi:hypothetical protein